MAMLAGPRRKQKVINLRAKNNAWSNDNNKFGQRMLEKMGWSAGKGLGANENGIVEHVVARYKNDDKGLGFEDRNDQWTKHDDDFNALLANLSNGGGDDEKLHSGISLEVKSKKSKARVHYHKFTRGKDLTRYSEKDLANIFGKKSLVEKDIPVEKEEELIKEDVKTTEQIFTEKGSMEDYFKSKLANFKSKSKVMDDINEIEEDVDYAFKGFSAISDENETSDNHNGFGYSLNSNSTKSCKLNKENGCLNNVKIYEDLDEQKERRKSKKKKKKSKCKEIEQDECSIEPCNVEDIQITSTEIDTSIDNINKSKKSKRKHTVEVTIEDEVKPKKKKSKSSDPLQESNEENPEHYVHKKKKKKNKK